MRGCVCASAQAQGDLCEGSRTNQLARKKLDHHDMQISDNQDFEKVFTNIRQKLNRSENEKILDPKVNVLIWWLFMSTTMKAAVLLGHKYNDNSVTNRNTDFEELKTLFDISQRLILDQDFEILNVSSIELKFTPWMRSTYTTWQSNHGRKQRYTSTQIQFFVWKDARAFRSQCKVERSTSPPNTKIYLGSTENQMSSSGIFSPDLQHCRFSNKSGQTGS